MLQGGSYQSRSTYQRVLVGSRATTTPHHLTTVQLTRVPGGGRFYAVCCRILLPAAASSLPDSLPRTPHAAQPLHVQPAVKARHESDELA